MKTLRRAFAGALLACSALAFGHQFHIGFTDLSYNARSASLEVVHTYHTDDVDALLANLYQRQFDLSRPEDEAVLRKYIEKQFWIAGADGKRLPLRWIGLSVGPETVVVYQEVANTALAQAAVIHHAILSDFLADQSNTLNITENGTVRTLSFNRQAQEQPLR
ncbi:DUF6702 family protein [Massilia sp. DWR3-1-1]|uniref:DUF6702 family protein n=1 Tax=Massilia sp. DWR3-1-1 TaxID=2804559 RepID=UPI003CEFB79A